MDKWWKTLDKAGDERGTRGDKRDLCQDCLRLFHTAGIMKGRNRWGALLGMLVSDGAGDGVREGSHPLALSRGCAGGDLDFQRGRFDCSGGEFGFRRNGRGALRSPTPPGRRGARGLRPSRALPWGCTGGDLSFRRCRHSGEEFGFRRSGRGALRSPTSPRGTGCERAATLSRSPMGLCW